MEPATMKDKREDLGEGKLFVTSAISQDIRR